MSGRLRYSTNLTPEQQETLTRLCLLGMPVDDTRAAFFEATGRRVCESTVYDRHKQLGVQRARKDRREIPVRSADKLQARIAAERFRRMGGFVILDREFSPDALCGRALSHYLKTTLAHGRTERLLAC